MDVQTRDEYFAGNSVSLGNFLFHYVVYPFIIGILIILVKDRHKLMDVSTFWSKTILWFIAFFVIFMCSAELDNIWLLAEGSSTMETHRILQLSHRVGYPVLWGILAFLLI